MTPATSICRNSFPQQLGSLSDPAVRTLQERQGIWGVLSSSLVAPLYSGDLALLGFVARLQAGEREGKQGTWFLRKPQVIVRPAEHHSFFVLIKARCCHLLSQQMLEQAPRGSPREKIMDLGRLWGSCFLPWALAGFPSKTYPLPQISRLKRTLRFGGRAPRKVIFPGAVRDRTSLLRACLGLHL